MRQIIAIANQKGGVGKTTSAISIASELALMGRKVLLLDLDPQGSATSGLGVNQLTGCPDLYDLFFGKTSLNSIVQLSSIQNLRLVPSSQDLISIEVELSQSQGRELILKGQLASYDANDDFIIIDCPPSSGLLTLNALGAANSVIIPLQAEYYALEGISALIRTIDFVKSTFNPSLKIAGVFITMYDARTNLSSQVENEARQFFKDLMFREKVPRSIKLSECPSHGVPISIYDPMSAGAKAYHEIAVELERRCLKNSSADQVAANA